jgi:mRNA interferase HicA
LTGATDLSYSGIVTSSQFRKWLARRGCQFLSMKSGHMKVMRSGRISYIPMHGSNRELGKGLVEKIKKDLGLKGE